MRAYQLILNCVAPVQLGYKNNSSIAVYSI
nr:MAG TPA: hypothetical protein [Caudoviricetes sp.]